MTEDLFFEDTFDSSSFLGKLDAKINTNNEQILNQQETAAIVLNDLEGSHKNTLQNNSKIDCVTFDDSLFLSESLSFNFENNVSQLTDINTKVCFESITTESIVSQPEENNKCADSIQNIDEYTQCIGTQTLSEWGLPESILQKYQDKKIMNMFPWQVECLNLEGVMKNNANLVYSAPTSAGKTLVAEILAIKTVVERKKKVLFILPFVSVVREKMFYLQDILSTNGIRVDGFMGSHNPPGGIEKVHIAICTMEKANSLINHMLEENTLLNIGAVIIDEMHLLGDPSRGYLLELLLTKLRYMSAKDATLEMQIIGMSATLPNLNTLAKWLNAQLYTTNFRPIPLDERVLINSEIYDSDFKLIRNLQPKPELVADTDNILQLCLETICDNCSVLIFCPTKNWCENLAQQISVAFYKLGNSGTDLGQLLRNQLNTESIIELLEQLKRCPVGLDKILSKAVSFGVAFHHAGLTMDERDIIESAFRCGTLRVLIATSTLSSGVNLPARRVIIRTPIFHGKPIDTLTYRQMIGRAGRMGKDTAGESILICQKNDFNIAKELLTSNLHPIESCLDESGRLKRAVLEVIASGVASTPDDIKLFTSCTLLAMNLNDDNGLLNPIMETVEFLQRNEFIRLQVTVDGSLRYVATGLGKACLSSSLPPEEGLALFAELEKARQCFVLDTELHLIYLVTPYSACNQWSNLDWMLFLNLWEKLPPSMRRVGELVGVRESYIINATRGKIQTNTSKLYQKLMIHKRFYTALALQDLVNEIPLHKVAEKFNCNRGMLQSLQQSASSFAGMVTVFSRQLGWSTVEILIAQFQCRLQFGISRDLLDLMRLPLLTGHKARALYDAGIESLVDLASADVYSLENVLQRALPFESGESVEKQKNTLKTVWIAGKQGLTDKEAALILINEARRYLLLEMGLVKAEWESENTTIEDHKSDGGNEFNLKLSTSEASTTTVHPRSDENITRIASEESLFNESDILEETCKDKRLSDDFIFNSQDDCISLVTNNFISSIKVTPPKKREHTTILLNANSPNSSYETPTKKIKFNRTDDVLNFQFKHMLNVSDTNKLATIEVIEVCDDENLFQTFCKELKQTSVISLSVGCSKIEETTRLIGIKKNHVNHYDYTELHSKNRRLNGIALSWEGNTVYYINFSNTKKISNMQKLSILKSLIFSNRLKTIRVFDCKEQLKVLIECCGVTVNCSVEDPKVADWLLNPENKEKNLQAMTVQYSPIVVQVGKLVESCKRNGSVGLEITSCIDAKIRASIESIITLHLTDSIRNVLIEQDFRLLDTYDTEMKVLVCLANMEVDGFSVNTPKVHELIKTLKQQQTDLENYAFSLAGKRFSMTSSRDVAKVIGICNGKKVSTSKAVLEKNGNPISNIVLKWRKLNSILTKMVYPLLSMVENEKIHGCCITHSSTGRITMHEPNLQNVARDFEIINPVAKKSVLISCRSVFSCKENYILLSADYCQLELRLLSHFSEDLLLCAVMKSKEDVFKSIAAKWNDITERQVTYVQRQHAKQICYGIIYGMGAKTLSEQLEIEEEIAMEFIDSFHKKYPGIKKYIQKVIDRAKVTGYVETMTGRRRYLPNINHENLAIKSQAERQAVNTTIQGSAADIVKKVMVILSRRLNDIYQGTPLKPKLVLHLHDELLYEVPNNQLLNVARIIKECMEESISLSIPLPVKFKSGPSWGQLKEFIL